MKYDIGDVERVLDKAPFEWLIAGGYGLELFLGHETREHSDVDIVVFRKDVTAVFDFLSSYDLQVVTGPGELLAHSKASDLTEERHSIWVKDKEAEDYLFELLFNDSDVTNWIYRRNKQITLPLDKSVIEVGELKILAPEIILLYKSKDPRDIDEQDFKNVFPSLSSESKTWLKNAIQLDYPDHTWLAQP